MELNEKLQAARIQNKLTQEQVCQQIGVSRQTLSSWENGKTFPDIVSLINLCGLYRLSLDDLLGTGESDDYIGFLDRAIAALKKRQKLYKIVELSVLATLMLDSVAAFFLTYTSSDTYGYFPGVQSGIYLSYRSIVIPFAILIVSLFIGVDTSWHNERWLLIPIIAGAFVLTSDYTLYTSAYLIKVMSGSAAFGTEDGMLAVSLLISQGITAFLLASGVTAAGLGIGTVYRRKIGAKNRQRTHTD